MLWIGHLAFLWVAVNLARLCLCHHRSDVNTSGSLVVGLWVEENSGLLVDFQVVVLGEIGMLRKIFDEQQRSDLRITPKSCGSLEGRIARKGWEYASSICM